MWEHRRSRDPLIDDVGGGVCPKAAGASRWWEFVGLRVGVATNVGHQQKALLVCQMCFPDAQIVWMLALIASLNQGFSITAILAGYYNPARIPNPPNPPNPKISPTTPRINNASPQQRLPSATLHNNSAEIVEAYG
jgi:hypothetical protein